MPKATRRNTTKSAVSSQNGSFKSFLTCEAMGTQEIMRGMMLTYSEMECELDTEAATVKDALRDLSDARDAYEGVLTFVRATSVEGAMAQLSVLHDRVELMFQSIANEEDREDLAPIRRTIERLLYSIAGVLRAVVGDKMADLVFEGDFSPMHDPLLKIERGMRGASASDTFDECFSKAAKPSEAIA